MARLDAILTNSAFTAANVAAIYGRRATPCHLGVPPPRYRAGMEADPPYVAWVSASALHKNAHGFLEAIRILLPRRIAARSREGLLENRHFHRTSRCLDRHVQRRLRHSRLGGEQ